MNDDGPADEGGAAGSRGVFRAGAQEQGASSLVVTVPAGATPLSTNVMTVLNGCFLCLQPVAAMRMCFLILPWRVESIVFRPAHTPGAGCWPGCFAMVIVSLRPETLPGVLKLTGSSRPSR